VNVIARWILKSSDGLMNTIYESKKKIKKKKIIDKKEITTILFSL
jgi:hypothetical protein